MNRYLLFLFIVLVFSSCTFLSNVSHYKLGTRDFMESLLKEDYQSCIGLMAMEHESARNTNHDSLIAGLAQFRRVVAEHFGTELEFSFMKAEKTFSTAEAESALPNTTRVLMQFSNKDHFGVLNVSFDDVSKKILYINTLNVKEATPSMFTFWLFGVLALCVPAFNIYVIRQIRKSNEPKKWLKYLVVILLNVPAVTYAAINGFSFDLLNFQFLFGISFGYMGYLNSFWTVGIPLGGLYWFWKLRQREDQALLIATLELEEKHDR